MLELLFAAEPANRDAQYYLSITYQSLGRVQERNSKWDLALESERQAVAISESLVTSDPANEQYRDLLADNYLHFGEALYQAGRGATIATIIRRSLIILGRPWRTTRNLPKPTLTMQIFAMLWGWIMNISGSLSMAR